MREVEKLGAIDGRHCPVTWPADQPPYDPTAADELIDPFPGWARARSVEPVFYSPEYDIWWVSKWTDVVDVLRSPETFSSAHVFDTPPPPADIAPRFVTGLPWEHTIASQDPPEHARLRELVQRALTPKLVAGREGDIRSIANDLLDRFPKQGRVDLAAEYGQPIPLTVITRMLGAPDKVAPRLRHWTDVSFKLLGSVSSLPPELLRSYYADTADCVEYCLEFIAERRREPGDDLATELINARTEDGSSRMSDAELIGTLLSLLKAGNETTASLISKSVYLLLQYGLWADVVADPSLIAKVLEETMRFSGPVKGVQRTAISDTVVGGVPIPAGSQLYLLLGSAGRDTDVWPDADEFDPGRKDVNKHVGLGRGIHFCVGAPLARLEARIAIEELAHRHPELRLAGDQPIDYHPMYLVHSPYRLNVEVG